VFSLARQEEKLRDAPYFPMLKEAPPRSGFIELDEYRRLFRVLSDYLQLPLAIGYFTGMRESEILNLTWDRIDLLRSTITLRPGETKNDEGRSIPMVSELRELLAAQRAKSAAVATAYVAFRIDRRGHAVKIGNFRKAWRSATKKAGLGGLLFHDLRRSAVRNLVRCGVPEQIAMDITGHKTRSVFSRYNIVSERDRQDAAKRLEEHFAFEHKTNTKMLQNSASGSVIQ